MTKAETIEAAVADTIRARGAAIDADPELAGLTLVVQLDGKGDVKMVLYRTESRVAGTRTGIRMPPK